MKYLLIALLAWVLWDIDDRTGKMYPVGTYATEKACKDNERPATRITVSNLTPEQTDKLYPQNKNMRSCFIETFDPWPRAK
jgi:hypothetical protein